MRSKDLRPKVITIVLILFMLIGCQGRKAFLEPITTGNWYRPHVDTTWQWQLSGKINTDYDVDLYDIDLFDTEAKLIDLLHQKGKKVICYFSAGSYEDWREDRNTFDKDLLGKKLLGWKGERWLDIRSEQLYPIMRNRLDLAVKKGCDGVEADNVDGYANETGFDLEASDQLYYNQFLANEAHKRGLSIGLKNDIDQVNELEPYFDFAINEQCHEYNECHILRAFIHKKKPVFNAEYKQIYIDNIDNKRDQMCSNALAKHFQTLVLPKALDDSFRISCKERAPYLR